MELPLNHEPCLNHWAKCMADEDVASGYHTNWNHAYESAWHYLDIAHKQGEKDAYD
jgi:hypothetical protein